MKTSKFNLLIKTKKSNLYILYNTLNGSIIKIDGKVLEILQNIKDTKTIPEELIENGFVLEDSFDEETYFTTKMNQLKYNSNEADFMVNITHACNLDCPYCFEGKNNFSRINKQTYNKIIKFIKNQSKRHSAKKVNLDLFGGEPLLEPKTVFRLIEEIKNWAEKENIKFTFMIYTNGTIRNKKILEQFKTYQKNIKYIHITLDGPQKYHNTKRINKNKNGTYKKIIKNLQTLKKEGIKTLIRLNIDNKNYKKVPILFKDLKNKKLESIPIYFSFIRDMTHTCKNYEGKVPDTFPKKVLPFLWKEALKRNLNFSIKPQASFIYCGAFKNSSYIIDTNGKVYKCAGLQGIEKHSIGKINKEGEIDKIKSKYYEFINRNPFSMSPCKDCKILPLCGGGCASCSYTRYKNYHIPNCFDKNINLIQEKVRIYLKSKYPKEYKGIL